MTISWNSCGAISVILIVACCANGVILQSDQSNFVDKIKSKIRDTSMKRVLKRDVKLME